MDTGNTLEYIYGLGDKIIKEREHAREHKSDFNFFTAIVSGKTPKDHIEKYHSNFIAFLLDPKANHDCEYKFQDLFLDELRSIPEFDSLTESLKRFPIVEREHKTGEGRYIDIVLEDRSENRILFIENKVRSIESENQILDYYNHSSTKSTMPIGIFLTPSGLSSTCSNHGIINLSYNNINKWLEVCISETKHQNIKIALTQFQSIIKTKILGMNINSKEILNSLNNDTRNYDRLDELFRSTTWEEIQNKFFDEFKKALERAFENWKLKSDNRKRLEIRYDYDFFWNDDTGFQIFEPNEHKIIRFSYYDGSHCHAETMKYGISLNREEPDWAIENPDGIEFEFWNGKQSWSERLKNGPDEIIKKIEELLEKLEKQPNRS